MSGWEFNPEEVAIVLQVKKDTLMRTVKKLVEKDLAEYRPPFRGTEIKLLKVVDPADLNLDFKALKSNAERAYDKLDEMENYVFQTGCRQEYILKYFGDLKATPCGHCDGCLKLQRHASGWGTLPAQGIFELKSILFGRQNLWIPRRRKNYWIWSSAIIKRSRRSSPSAGKKHLGRKRSVWPPTCLTVRKFGCRLRQWPSFKSFGQ